MAEIQSMGNCSSQCSNFDDLDDAYMRRTLHHFTTADTVVQVYDRYDHENSVNAEERTRRQRGRAQSQQYQVAGGRIALDLST